MEIKRIKIKNNGTSLIFAFLMIIFSFICAGCESDSDTENLDMNTYQVLKNGIYYAELDGTQGGYELGKQNGEIFKELIKENLQILKTNYASWIGGEETLNEILNKISTESRYLSDLKQFMPELHDELRGIADGSGITMEDAVILNYLDETILAVSHYSEENSEASSVKSEEGERCTSGALFGRNDIPNMTFQNMDFSDAYNGYQALYRIHYDDKDILLYGFVGQFGGVGINSNGVGVTVNIIGDGMGNNGFGIPSTATTRGILQLNSVDEAVEWLKTLPISSAHSLIIADPKKAIGIEATANNIFEMTPQDEKYVVHSNHCLQTPDKLEGSEINDEESNTVVRLNIVLSMLEGKEDLAGVDDIIEILSTEPVLDIIQDSQGGTVQSVISVCDANAPHLYVAKASDKNRQFVKVDFE
jgi:isopenicillin-N N-acyltransferase-like protein